MSGWCSPRLAARAFASPTPRRCPGARAGGSPRSDCSSTAAKARSRAAIEAAGLDAIQLHGSETPVQAARLRDRYRLPVWKAMAGTSRADLHGMADYSGAADLILSTRRPRPARCPADRGWRSTGACLRVTAALCPGVSPAAFHPATSPKRSGSPAPLVDSRPLCESAPWSKDVTASRPSAKPRAPHERHPTAIDRARRTRPLRPVRRRYVAETLIRGARSGARVSRGQGPTVVPGRIRRPARALRVGRRARSTSRPG